MACRRRHNSTRVLYRRNRPGSARASSAAARRLCRLFTPWRAARRARRLFRRRTRRMSWRLRHAHCMAVAAAARRRAIDGSTGNVGSGRAARDDDNPACSNRVGTAVAIAATRWELRAPASPGDCAGTFKCSHIDSSGSIEASAKARREARTSRARRWAFSMSCRSCRLIRGHMTLHIVPSCQGTSPARKKRSPP